MSNVCVGGLIPSDPEIAGVGVRISIYIQVLILNIHLVWYFKFRHGANDLEFEHFRAILQSGAAVLVSGFAIVLSAIIQATRQSLQVYHALIVLDLCWLISITSGALVNVFAGPSDVLVKQMQESFRIHGVVEDFRAGSLNGVIMGTIFWLASMSHLTFMSAFGLWLFLNLRTFDHATPACTLLTKQSFLGGKVPISSKGVRDFWLVLYFVCVIPVVNHIALNLITDLPFRMSWNIFAFIRRRISGRPMGLTGSAILQWQLLCRAITSAVLTVIIIISLELTIPDNDVSPGEGTWTFGQTLVMFLIIPGLWTACRQTQSIYARYRKDPDEAQANPNPAEQPV